MLKIFTLKKDYLFKKLKKYLSVFLYISIIFIIFGQRLSFGEASCLNATEENGINIYDTCRENKTDMDAIFNGVGLGSTGSTLNKTLNDKSEYKNRWDIDGNIPVECAPAEPFGKYNPVVYGIAEDENGKSTIQKGKNNDYYYDPRVTACLEYGLTLSITNATLSTTFDQICLRPTQMAPSIAALKGFEKATSLGKALKVLQTVISIGKVLVNSVGGVIISTVTDPTIMTVIEAPINTAKWGINLGLNVSKYFEVRGEWTPVCAAEAAATAGTAFEPCMQTAILAWCPRCTANMISCGVAMGTYLPTLLAEIVTFTNVRYNKMKEGLNSFAICGDDWNSYAYTNKIQESPIIEWYPDYGSYSNSYSYKINGILNGKYTCTEFLETDYLQNGKLVFNSETKKCPDIEKIIDGSYSFANYLNVSNCQSVLKDCLIKHRDESNNADLDYCLTDRAVISSCNTEHCARFYGKCAPVLDVLLDGEGICNTNTSSNDNYIQCKGIMKPITMTTRTMQNRIFREKTYGGKEFIIDYKSGSIEDCYDPRPAEVKGYNGFEQRYYYKGYEAGNYACSRFIYDNGPCWIREEDGIFRYISPKDISKDPSLIYKCQLAYLNARTCCNIRSTTGICVYRSRIGETNDKVGNYSYSTYQKYSKYRQSGVTENYGRNYNTLCLRPLNSDEETESCELTAKVKTTEGSSGIMDTITYKFYAKAGEINSQDICIRSYNQCPYQFNVSGGTEYRATYCEGKENDQSCKDYYKIWEVPNTGKAIEGPKQTAYGYGKTSNYCTYRAHCTQAGVDIDLLDSMDSNKFISKACRDFIGDSQFLPDSIYAAGMDFNSKIKSILISKIKDEKIKNLIRVGGASREDILRALNNMSNAEIAELSLIIFEQRAFVSYFSSLAPGNPLVNVIGMTAGYTINDMQNMLKKDYITTYGQGKIIYELIVGAIEGKSSEDLKEEFTPHYKEQLAEMVYDLLTRPVTTLNGDLTSSYRGFTAPIAQCFKETLNNMFQNKAGTSFCKIVGESVNAEGLCGRDTFGPPVSIRHPSYDYSITDDTSAYYYIIGGSLPEEYNIFKKIQNRLRTLIKLSTAIMLVFISINFLLSGKLDLFGDTKMPKALIVGMLKFAIVYYFSIGDAWQSTFYDWVDKFTMGLYNMAFNLSFTNYSNYRTASDSYMCSVKTTTYKTDLQNVEDYDYTCKTYYYKGKSEKFVVPENVKKILVYAYGAQGGAGYHNAVGGTGALMIREFNVIEGEIFDILVGEKGHKGRNGFNSENYNTIINENCGGGGGYTSISMNGTPYLVAAGGGGGACAMKLKGYNAYVKTSNSGFGGSAGTNNKGGKAGKSYVLESALVKNSSYSNGSADRPGYNYDNGLLKVCYKQEIPKYVKNIYTPSETVREEIKKADMPWNISKTRKEVCISNDTYDENNVKFTNEKCYSECYVMPSKKENSDGTYNYTYEYEYNSDYDGCYFGDNTYPEGKSYLAIFDTLDCKTSLIFGYGPDVSLPGIFHFLFISMIWSPLGLITVTVTTVFFVIMLFIAIKILYIFLMAMLAINIMIYVSPIVFPCMLHSRTKGIFDKWLENFQSFCIQYIFILIFTGLLVTTFEQFTIGDAYFSGWDEAGRFPHLICPSDYSGSLLCIFNGINVSKGTAPAFGKTLYNIFGIGPLVTVVTAISSNFKGTLYTIIQGVLSMFVLLSFIEKIPGVATSMIGGKPLNGVNITDKTLSTMSSIFDYAGVARRLGKGMFNTAAKKLSGAFGTTKGKGGGDAGTIERKDNDNFRNASGGKDSDNDDTNKKDNNDNFRNASGGKDSDDTSKEDNNDNFRNASGGMENNTGGLDYINKTEDSEDSDRLKDNTGVLERVNKDLHQYMDEFSKKDDNSDKFRDEFKNSFKDKDIK